MNTEFFQNNFGGYLLAGAVVLVEYAALTTFAPRLASPILMVTVMSIILIWFSRTTGKGETWNTNPMWPNKPKS